MYHISKTAGSFILVVFVFILPEILHIICKLLNKRRYNMGDIEIKVNLKADKNSKEFDEMILQSLIGKSFAIENFEEELKKVFKKKSSSKLWWDNKPVDLWDGKEYHKVNYRCCPSSHKARYIFGLVLDRSEKVVTIKNGFLEAI